MTLAEKLHAIAHGGAILYDARTGQEIPNPTPEQVAEAASDRRYNVSPPCAPEPRVCLYCGSQASPGPSPCEKCGGPA